MTVWFTSDEHYGHRNIIRYSARPFGDLAEMHDELVRRHNGLVGPDDFVWHLGDFALDERLVRQYLPRLNGRHGLVVGNHDKCHPCHHGHVAAVERYRRYGFAQVTRGFVEKMGGRDVRVEHMPYRGDHSAEERYREHRPVDQGMPLLHGHVHEAWKTRDRMINCGVDVWGFFPVAFDQIAEIVAGLP
jgi:calcineurin-like phosphoesterase family protein